jgi:homocysteine S-methyltransferase
MSGCFAPFLARRGLVVLDGALATELEARGADLADPLWSARVLLEQPELIREVHDAYFAAGADVATTATYQASFEGFAGRGLTAASAEGLMREAVAIAVASRDAFWSVTANRAGRERPLVAASVGPYGAVLADGSEYRGDYPLSEAELLAWHRPRFRVLADSGADLLACETIPCAREARALVRLLEEHPGTEAWISCSARDGAHLSSGEPFAPLVEELAGHPQVVGIGVNCTAPRHIASLLASAAGASGAVLLTYPNSGETYRATDKRWVAGSEAASGFAAGAAEWHAAGARAIGGCCRTTPADIRALVAWAAAAR